MRFFHFGAGFTRMPAVRQLLGMVVTTAGDFTRKSELAGSAGRHFHAGIDDSRRSRWRQRRWRGGFIPRRQKAGNAPFYQPTSNSSPAGRPGGSCRSATRGTSPWCTPAKICRQWPLLPNHLRWRTPPRSCDAGARHRYRLLTMRRVARRHTWLLLTRHSYDFRWRFLRRIDIKMSSRRRTGNQIQLCHQLPPS